MVILLDGASALARASIAEQIAQSMPTWKHLALEVIAGRPDSMGDPTMHVELVKRCMEELAKENLHLILSMPESAHHLKLLRADLAPHCLAVHIGEGDEEQYDFSFDSSVTSIKDIVTFLTSVIDRLPPHA